MYGGAAAVHVRGAWQKVTVPQLLPMAAFAWMARLAWLAAVATAEATPQPELAATGAARPSPSVLGAISNHVAALAASSAVDGPRRQLQGIPAACPAVCLTCQRDPLDFPVVCTACCSTASWCVSALALLCCCCCGLLALFARAQPSCLPARLAVQCRRKADAASLTRPLLHRAPGAAREMPGATPAWTALPALRTRCWRVGAWRPAG